MSTKNAIIFIIFLFLHTTYGMYPYHNMIKKRIKNGELYKIQPINNEQFAFAFIFKTEPHYRPIRYHSVSRYSEILKTYGYKL